MVVAMPQFKAPRTRRPNEAMRKACAMVTIDNGKPNEDSHFVVRLMREQFARHGVAAPCIDPTAPMLVARHKLTGEQLGFCSIKPIPGGKMYVENFIVVDGRKGRIAARALIERIMAMPMPKVCMVTVGNMPMLRILEHYRGRVVGYVLEGPISGADEVPAAAAPMEHTG